MIEWYTKDPWKAYISWFSPRWAMPRDQFDAVEWVDKLVRGGFRVAVMHTKHHDGVCFFPSAYRRGQPERDFIGELVAEAHRREMKIVAYYSPTVDAWSCQEHPEWCCRERDGSPIEIDWAPYPGLGVGCVNNPGYRALQLIRTIIAEDSSRHRFALSQVVCERLHWRRANGQLKDMSCRVAMLRMHRDGLIPLPAPRRRHSNGTLHRRRTPQAEPELPIIARVDALPALQVRPLADQREAQLWREYVDRYHYLGYTPLPGAQMRYLVTSQRRVLAVVGFGASAWKAAPRDRFIGWSVAQREARLQLVVNNARFLILPWVQVRNLASTVLAHSSRRLPDDWQARYGYRPLLLETFVQSDRFAGTSYRAANWTHVGQTQGRGKLDVHRTHALPRKDIWLYPLRRDFRRRLCAPLDPPPHR